MKKKTFEDLKDPEQFKTGNIEYAVGKIPAFYAQRIMLASGEALGSLDVSKIPEPALLELLSYCAVKNPSGDYVVLDDVDVLNLLVPSPKDLIAIELKAVEYNFGFFFDGSLREVFTPMVELIKKAAGQNKTSTPSVAS